MSDDSQSPDVEQDAFRSELLDLSIRSWLKIVIVTIAFVAFLVLAVWFSWGSDIGGVIAYPNQARDHSTAPQVYAVTPPVGGVHTASWQNCGLYLRPVRNEPAVHSLEHGAVWITYRPDLTRDALAVIQSAAAGRPYVLISPYPGLPTPLVASAWGLQLRLTDPADPRLVQFIAEYMQGPQTPEPGAPCAGGVSTRSGVSQSAYRTPTSVALAHARALK